MLMDIKCSAVTSVKVNLKFDDGSTKERVVGVGDLVTVDYNANGLRKHIDGKVLAVSANGIDPKGWYIIVDSSDDFEAAKAKFSPMSILDIEIIRKADTVEVIKTPIGSEGIPYMRIKKGVLQYSVDGFNWKSIKFHHRDIIEDQEGTVPDFDHEHEEPHHHGHHDFDDDGIKDANY